MASLLTTVKTIATHTSIKFFRHCLPCSSQKSCLCFTLQYVYKCMRSMRDSDSFIFSKNVDSLSHPKIIPISNPPPSSLNPFWKDISKIGYNIFYTFNVKIGSSENCQHYVGVGDHLLSLITTYKLTIMVVQVYTKIIGLRFAKRNLI